MIDAAYLLPSNHTKNVAVLVQSSPFFHNYRHTSNILSIYQALKQFGNFTDDNIILMMAEEIPWNARNALKGTMAALYSHHTDQHSSNSKVLDLWDDDVEIDYIGSDVTVEALLHVLTGRSTSQAAFDDANNMIPFSSNRQLPHMDENTNLFLYLTGHGGDTFFKFRDYEEITTQDLIHTFADIHLFQRFHEVLFVTDTCQAYTLSPNYNPSFQKGETSSSSSQQGDEQQSIIPNIYSIASSLKGQYSYSHHSDGTVGVSVVDRYSYEFVQFMNQRSRWKNMHSISLKRAFVDSMYPSYQSSIIESDVGWDDVGCKRKLNQVPLSDFLVMRQQRHHLGARNTLGNDHNIFDDDEFFMLL